MLGAITERMKFSVWVAFITIWLLVVYLIGARLLWMGWFGFNAGRAWSASPLAALAFLNTSTAASAAVVVWALIEVLPRGKPTALGGATAAVAGLVAITPACGNVSPMGAIAIGIGVSIVSYAACTFMKPAPGYDDSLDVFGVHALGGAWGRWLRASLPWRWARASRATRRRSSCSSRASRSWWSSPRSAR